MAKKSFSDKNEKKWQNDASFTFYEVPFNPLKFQLSPKNIFFSFTQLQVKMPITVKHFLRPSGFNADESWR